MSRRRAFTMVEMIVVTIVLGALAMVVVPRLRGIEQENNYRRGYNRLTFAADAARDRAIQTGQTQVLSFNPSNNTLEIGSDDDQAQNPINVSRTLGLAEDTQGQPSQTITLGGTWNLESVQNLTTQESQSSLRTRFFADGTSEPIDALFRGDGVEVHLRINRNGISSVSRGSVNDNADDQQQWEAGELEVRNAG